MLSGLGVGAGWATSPLVFVLSFASAQAAIVTDASLAFAMELKVSPMERIPSGTKCVPIPDQHGDREPAGTVERLRLSANI